MTEFCALQSLETAEPLAGTAAAETTIWLALEHVGPWGARAIEDNNLPAKVQGWLAGQTAAVPQHRILFIRHERYGERVGRHLFVAITREGDQRLYHIYCPTDEALLEVDVAELVADTAAQHPAHTTAPLFFVCTNGKRDQCCSKFGLPIYTHLAAQLPAEQVWQCTHIGGHRYAATAVALPMGVYYGHLTPATAEQMVFASQRGGVMLAGYRGRTCYPAAVQAADYFLRRHTGQLALSAFRWVGGEGQTVILQDEAGVSYTVALRLEQVDSVMAGCSKQKYEEQIFYHLAGISVYDV